MEIAEDVLKLAIGVGFDRAVVLSYSGLLYAIEVLKNERIGEHARQLLVELEKLDFAISSVLSEISGDINPEKRGTFLICALSYNMEEKGEISLNEGPYGLIAPFARRNYYKESVNRLKRVFRVIREKTGLRKRDGRIFCNSRIPEKPPAYIGGLGFYGKNTLIITPGLGSLFVIGILFFPLDLKGFDYNEEKMAIYHRIKRDNYWGDYCKKCNRCISACPVGAIEISGALREEKCFSYISAREISLTEGEQELWGDRLYGCQTCQDVCPYNIGVREKSYEALPGDIGPGIPLRRILSMETEEIKSVFKGTQMGLSWVSGDAIKRNAIIAAGNSRDASLIDYVSTYEKSPKEMLRRSAVWALKKLARSKKV